MKKILTLVMTMALLFVAVISNNPFDIVVKSATEGIYEYSYTDTFAEIRNVYHNGPEEDIIIPSTLGGLPVTRIRKDAFRHSAFITGITIPDSVTYIGECAFEECLSLTKVKIGSGIETISCEAFNLCRKLTSITLPDKVISIDGGVFKNTGYYNNSNNWENGMLYIGKHLISAKPSISGSCTIKSDTLDIAEGTFSNCTNITDVIIPDSVVNIGEFAFNLCKSLKSITLGKGVQNIGVYAFDTFGKIENVYYRGTYEDAQKITINFSNEKLTNAKWYYNSCIGKAEHDYANPCDSVCTSCGFKRKISHFYDNECDYFCNECSSKRKAPHIYSNDEDLICNGCEYERQLYTPGDINNNGLIDLTDVVVLAQLIAGWDVECNNAAADTNADGYVTLTDIVHLSQYIAKWDEIILS